MPAIALRNQQICSWPETNRYKIVRAMPSTQKRGKRGSFRHRILIADADQTLLAKTAAMLSRQGYDVEKARDGFEALALLRGSLPDALISELKMPNMSGFELLSIVRKRFPSISVIAMSSEFTPASMPNVLADCYLQKGKNFGAELAEMVRGLMSKSPLRAQPAKAETAPAWIPHSVTSYVVLTCPECLRSFSIFSQQVNVDGVAQTDRCVHCGQGIRYRIDSTVAATAGVPPNVLERLRQHVQDTQAAIRSSKQRLDQKRED